MTVTELINKFQNDKQWIDICTPLGRLSGTKEKILSEYDYSDVKVSNWRVTLTNVLEIDV